MTTKGNVNWSDFQYVVERKLADPICFGSKVPRNTDPIGKGLSPFQKRQAPELFTKTGPGRYGVDKLNTALGKLLNKVRSNRGVGPLASGDPRFKEKIFLRTPSPTKYDIIPPRPPKRQTQPPFGSNIQREFVKDNKLPGPGNYPIPKRMCRRTRFRYNLGQPEMIPATEITCMTKPRHVCLKCEQTCDGDYWRKDEETTLCHLCWMEERRYPELYTPIALKTFKKIRNCSFAHRHEGTTAAIRLLPPKKIIKRLRLENYLDLYIHC